MACEATQYSCIHAIARVFRMRARFWGVIPVVARDTYVAGKGRMRARLLDLLTVVDERGHELDIGELVTWLDDAILFAPSMLLGPETVWSAVDAGAFDVALTDHGNTVRGRVFVDERGAPHDFSTTDRSLVDGVTRISARWTTPIDGWHVDCGRSLPTSGRAVWHLPEGEFAYAEFRLNPGQVVFNVPPGNWITAETVFLT